MKCKIIVCLAFILSVGTFGCSTVVTHPSGLPLRYHDAQYDLTFFLPAAWQGYRVLANEWSAELYSADYQSVIGTEHGTMIVLRHARWRADEPYQDIPILVFTRTQWEAVKPQRLFIGAGGADEEISHDAKYVFGINSRHNCKWIEGLGGNRENCSAEHEPQALIMQERVEPINCARNLRVKILWRKAVSVCPILDNRTFGKAGRHF